MNDKKLILQFDKDDWEEYYQHYNNLYWLSKKTGNIEEMHDALGAMGVLQQIRVRCNVEEF